MIYVFPVSLSDAHLIDPLCDVIGHLGGMKGRQVVVVSDPQAAAAAGHLHGRLLKLDAKSTIHTFPSNLTQGWPVACNHYFAMTVGYLTNKLRITEPFYYFELDNTPVKEGWLERIGSEWGTAVTNRKPFMGVIRDYTAQNQAGQISVQGKILNGSCVYHPDFGKTSPLLRSVFKTNLPWDVYMRWELCGRPSNPSVHDISQYVVFNWGTENYRWEGNEIKCDVRPRPAGILTSDKTYPITQDTVLVHGCKEGSLARLIMAQSPQKANEATPAPEKPKTATRLVIAPTPAAPPEEVRSIIADLLKAEGKLPDGVEMPKPAIVEQAKKPVPRSYTKTNRTIREKKKRNISPEDRKARSERMKQMHAAKKKLLVAA